MKTDRFLLLNLLLLSLAACSAPVGCNGGDDDDTVADDDIMHDDDVDDDADDDTQDPLDADGDGWTVIEGDCDDHDPGIHPDADDPPCDGIDHDCDGAIGAYVGDVMYPTIQAAIDAAETGETVAICSGTHIELISVTEQMELHVTSESGDAEDTVLDGSGCGPILTVGAYVEEIHIDNLTFKNGVTTKEIGEYENGGAVHSDAETLLVENSLFLDNWAAWRGGAIYQNGPTAEIAGCTFEGNQSGNAGGAIELDDSQGVYEIRDATFSSNIAGCDGGAISASGEIRIAGSTLIGNDSSTKGCYGGGVSWHSTDYGMFSMEGAVLDGNTSDFGGGISFQLGMDRSVDISIVQSIFLENQASYEGGAIFWEGFGEHGATTSFWIEDSSFDGNSAGVGAGAVGIEGPNIVSSTVLRSTFTGNSATSAGGAVLAVPNIAADLLFQECEFRENNVQSYGGAICLGGGLFSESDPYTVALVDTILDGNQADLGGAIQCSSELNLTSLQLFLTDGSVTRNDQGGILLEAGCVLESSDVDWGIGAMDNIPHDVNTDGETYDSYGAAATFYCEGGGSCS